VCVWSRTTHLFNQHGDEKVFGQIKDKSRKAYIKAWLDFRAFNPTNNFDVSHPGEEDCKDKIPYFRNKNIPRSLGPNFHIHASVSDLCISTICLPILLEEICRPILGLYMYIAHRHMNVEIGAKAALFPEKEYINGIFVAVKTSSPTSSISGRRRKLQHLYCGLPTPTSTVS
jgi:hypothetical protein